MGTQRIPRSQAAAAGVMIDPARLDARARETGEET